MLRVALSIDFFFFFFKFSESTFEEANLHLKKQAQQTKRESFCFRDVCTFLVGGGGLHHEVQHFTSLRIMYRTVHI